MIKKLLAVGAALFLFACEPPEYDPPIEADAMLTPGETLAAAADEYLDAVAALSPFSAIFSGLGSDIEISNAAFDDNSPEGRAALEALEDDLLKRLSVIDPEKFENRSDWVLYHSLLERLEANAGLRICQSHLWDLNHMFGWQNGLSLLADAQPVETAMEKADALIRWRQLPGYIQQERAYLEEGIINGYSAPKRVAARVLEQLNGLIDLGPGQSPFISFAANSQDKDFQEKARKLAVDEIYPAIISFRDYLRDEYIPAARDALTITAIPDGAACYEAMLRDYHTAEIGSQITYQHGREAVEAYKRDVIARGETMFGLADFEAILAHVNEVPENKFESEEALIEETRALIPVTYEKIAPFFSALPKQELIVEPYPDYLKGTGQSSRYEQKPPSEGAAIYRISTDDWRETTRGGAEIVAVHEGWPGHHLQIATSNSLGDLHPVMKLLGSTAYIEGWARYAEALAEEAGVYQNGYGEITRRAWPARGMVVDPGLHVFGWTNEEAKAFLKESGRFEDEESLEARLDRIAVIPGQLTAYDTGGLEIFALRREAEEALGGDFDIKAFHDRVLENGAVPLGALRTHVRKWIEEETAKK